VSAMEFAELARTNFEAFNRGGAAAVLGILRPDVEVHSSGEVGEAGTYHGHEGYLHWVQLWMDAWEEFRVEVDEIEELGDGNVLVHVTQHGRGQGSGLEVTQTVVYLFTMVDGLASRLHIYRDREAALQAVTS
jgi:ketosteroid isomerase-like protein